MTRYRPPTAPSSPYITRTGYDALQKELSGLWRHTRLALVRKVAEAAAMGDRSENAEYLYGKKQLRETDRRIRYLSRRLDELRVVEQAPSDPSRVRFGAWVEVVRATPRTTREAGWSTRRASGEAGGETHCYRLVGPDEADASAGKISIDSPMARALLNRQVGTSVRVGDDAWRLIGIRYAPELPSGRV